MYKEYSQRFLDFLKDSNYFELLLIEDFICSLRDFVLAERVTRMAKKHCNVDKNLEDPCASCNKNCSEDCVLLTTLFSADECVSDEDRSKGLQPLIDCSLSDKEK